MLTSWQLPTGGSLFAAIAHRVPNASGEAAKRLARPVDASLALYNYCSDSLLQDVKLFAANPLVVSPGTPPRGCARGWPTYTARSGKSWTTPM